MRYGEQFESTVKDWTTGHEYTYTAVCKYASWKNFHTDNYGEGLWNGDRQIRGTDQFTVAGCKTEKAAKAKIKRYAERLFQ